MMIDNVFNLLFRCRHNRLTRPLTPTSIGGSTQGDSYIGCLDCGARFAYNTREMRIGKRIPDSELPAHASRHTA